MKKIIEISPNYRELKSFVENIDISFASGGETIYQARNEIKIFEKDMNGNALPIPLVVKRFALPRIPNNIIYRFFRKPKAVRSFLYAKELQQRGIGTPTPIGYVLFQSAFEVKHSYLITMKSPLSHTMYEFDEKPLNGREDIVLAFARFAAYIHDHDTLHLDFSPGNILFSDNKDGGNGYDFQLVDINRMRFAPVSLKEGCKNFQRLWGGEEFMEVLAKGYAEARHFPYGKVRDLIHKYHHDFWKNR